MSTYWLIPLLSLHTAPYNNFTPGIGLEAQQGNVSRAVTVFVDSESNVSGYAAIGKFYGDTIRYGAVGGVMTRKLRGTFPYLLPAVQYKYLNIVYVPPFDTSVIKTDAALHFQLRVPVEW